MQGKKHYQEKLFTNFQLSDRVPADNLYRKLKGTLDHQFLYDSTAKYYGKDGQKSVDPIVFFKLLLVVVTWRISRATGVLLTYCPCALTSYILLVTISMKNYPGIPP